MPVVTATPRSQMAEAMPRFDATANFVQLVAEKC
jgi:hypothetical protein